MSLLLLSEADSSQLLWESLLDCIPSQGTLVQASGSSCQDLAGLFSYCEALTLHLPLRSGEEIGWKDDARLCGECGPGQSPSSLAVGLWASCYHL